MKAPAWLLPPKPKRLFILFSILLTILAGEKIYRRWTPTHTHTTTHYEILSSAQRPQSFETGNKVEALYTAYGETFKTWPQLLEPHARLKLKLFKDRAEFRRCNRGIGWAEAFYRTPYCHAYYSAEELNPHHWMLHEAVHQLNHEVAHLDLAKWADEGLSEYFSTSLLRDDRLEVGHVDRNTYPVWWLDELKLSGNLPQDLADGTVIPLRAILNGYGGPSLNDNFNLYYLHWWSLTHLLFEGQHGKYREQVAPLLCDGASLESFEKRIGPVDRLQTEWYQHLQDLQWRLFRISPTNHSTPQGKQLTFRNHQHSARPPNLKLTTFNLQLLTNPQSSPRSIKSSSSNPR